MGEDFCGLVTGSRCNVHEGKKKKKSSLLFEELKYSIFVFTEAKRKCYFLN